MKKLIVTATVFVLVFITTYYIFTGGLSRLKLSVMPQKVTSSVLMQELETRYFGISPFWLERYHASVEVEEDIQEDADEDGLTLEEEYKYNTHPFDADTDHDGYTDGEEVKNGYSPRGDGRLDANRNNLPDDWEGQYGITGDNAANNDDDNDELSNAQEFRYGTDPKNADSDSDGFMDGKEVKNGYDPTAPGDVRPTVSIAISKIGVEAPVVLSEDASEEALQKDLENGVIRYPDMSMPGQRGNTYIAGHSSNYVWSQGQYNYVFKDLVKLAPGDVIKVKETLQNGKVITHKYDVTVQEEVAPDAHEIFADSQSSVLTLTTCWPLGTADRRIMVKASLDDTEL